MEISVLDRARKNYNQYFEVIVGPSVGNVVKINDTLRSSNRLFHYLVYPDLFSDSELYVYGR